MNKPDPQYLATYGSRAWRLSNLYKITDKDGQKVRFRPNAAQRKFMNRRNGRDIILKARQLGMTTLACIQGLDEAIWQRNWAVLIIAHTMNDAVKIFETKVRQPFLALPPSIQKAAGVDKWTETSIRFKHGSSVEVAVSGRSGTYQRLHISEFGKICAQYPNKAREIVTGALPAVGKNIVTIESTAEGQEGYFYEMCQRAQSEAELGREDWRFHFFPWMDDPNYVYDPMRVMLTQEDLRYFATLEHELGRAVTPEQRAWWKKQSLDLGADMKRENPATPKEAFEQAIEGAYFQHQIMHSEKMGSIGRFPFDPRYRVNTFWDLGRNDKNTIWLHQFVQSRHRFIGYYENSGEYIGHYIEWLRSWAEGKGAVFQDHYWPHDGNRDDLFLENGRMGTVEQEYKFFPRIVQRSNRKLEAIEAARRIFPLCDFDEEGCNDGLTHLRLYRKQWDESRGIFRDQPLHNDASHGADGFMTFATGWEEPETFEPRLPTIKQVLDNNLPMSHADEFQIDYSEEDGKLDYW